MHHALLGMPADNLKPDDLVHGGYVLSPNPPKEKKIVTVLFTIMPCEPYTAN